MRLTAALLAATAVVASAGTISTVGQDLTSPVSVTGITSFSATGATMDGLRVTGSFSNGDSIFCDWADTGATSGGCSASNGTVGFILGLTGNTFTANWILSSITGARLLSLTFDGLAGFTVFDRSFGGATGTTGSSLGGDASGTTADGAGITINGLATYLNPVGIGVNPPVNDLFATVVINFINSSPTGPAGLAPGNTATWNMDTDNVSGIPEPGTFGMLGAALVGLAVWRKRARA